MYEIRMTQLPPTSHHSSPGLIPAPMWDLWSIQWYSDMFILSHSDQSPSLHQQPHLCHHHYTNNHTYVTIITPTTTLMSPSLHQQPLLCHHHYTNNHTYAWSRKWQFFSTNLNKRNRVYVLSSFEHINKPAVLKYTLLPCFITNVF